MSKLKTVFSCSSCSYISAKWVGCCPDCKEWNSFVEQAERPTSSVFGAKKFSSQMTTLDSIDMEFQARIESGIDEWDRVLGGGILPGSFLILTGDPGIGKSTLLLQVADAISLRSKKVFYFSCEESLTQVKGRMVRLGLDGKNVLFSESSCLEEIVSASIDQRPDLVIIDSIQNCFLSQDTSTIPGTISQLRESGFRLMKFAKENGIATIVTGHITKEGYIAGPKVLEHMVDGVFYLQGEDRWQTRMLRSVKNRFGTINEIGFFEMGQEGMAEVRNINQHLVDEFCAAPGSALVCCVEGKRPIILDLQALCVASKFNVPQRIVTGVEHKRVFLVAGILEKYLHIKFSSQDIFFKVSGGFFIKESSIDLGIAVTLLSSFFQIPLPEKSLVLGELNLSGQVKSSNQATLRTREAQKFGLNRILCAKDQKIEEGTEKIGFKNIYEILKIFPKNEK